MQILISLWQNILVWHEIPAEAQVMVWISDFTGV